LPLFVDASNFIEVDIPVDVVSAIATETNVEVVLTSIF